MDSGTWWWLNNAVSGTVSGKLGIWQTLCESFCPFDRVVVVIGDATTLDGDAACLTGAVESRLFLLRFVLGSWFSGRSQSCAAAFQRYFSPNHAANRK